MTGEEFPISQTKKLFKNIIMIIQFVALVIVLAGQTIKQYLNFIPQNIFDYIEEKKWIMSISLFLVGNMIQSYIASSGAFEVYLNNKIVFIFSNFNLDLVKIGIQYYSSIA